MRKYIQHFRKAFILFAVLLLANCNIPKAAQLVEVSLVENPSPTGWIDAPLDRSTLPLAPYEVVFHVTDQQAVAAGELSIDGQVVATLENEDNDKLATMKYMWDPAKPGEYMLSVRAQSSSGAWGPASDITVWVGEVIPTITYTPTLTQTITPTTTITITATPTFTPTITGGVSNVSASPLSVYSGNCSPNQVTISAKATDANGITAVVLFYRLREDGGTATAWMNASMNPSGADMYTKTVNVSSAASQVGLSNPDGTFEYQIVIQNKKTEMVRSPMFYDVTVVGCGGTLPDIQILPQKTIDVNIFPTKVQPPK
jgi:hypothetical protein